VDTADRVPYVRRMPSLHIEHPITDLATWTTAFNAFAEARQHAGVTGEQIRHPVGDENFVVVDLEFDSIDQAEVFLEFLRTQVWAVPENSPGLVGNPDAKVLEVVEVT
jgi:hypothetical protein